MTKLPRSWKLYVKVVARYAAAHVAINSVPPLFAHFRPMKS
jgi:hypothetical protein